MNLAGLPAQISFDGIFFEIKEQAPIILFSPIVTPLSMDV
jgi:hypothetical protein